MEKRDGYRMKFIKEYFKKRKEASVLHRLIYLIEKVRHPALPKRNVYTGDDEYERWICGMQELKDDLENDFKNWSSKKKEEYMQAGLLDDKCNLLEWFDRLAVFSRKQLKGKMPMICWQGVCISIWEIPIWIVAIATLLFFIG